MACEEVCAAESEALKDCVSDWEASRGSLETGLEGVVNASVEVGWDMVDFLCGCLWYCLGEVLIVFCLGDMGYGVFPKCSIGCMSLNY